jgi:hypothetical protein
VELVLIVYQVEDGSNISDRQKLAWRFRFMTINGFVL